MNLHRTKRAQWADVPAADRNRWQRVAAASHSIVTPANIVSVAGALLVFYGLYAIIKDSLGIGIVAIALGRLADIADGFIAEYTATKSPLGEAVDATIDKVALAAALGILLLTSSLPLIIGLVMVAHGIYNSVVSVVAWFGKVKLHPSRLGKYATGIEWVCVATYLLAQFTQQQPANHLALLAGAGCFVVYVMTAFYSSAAYTHEYITQKRT